MQSEFFHLITLKAPITDTTTPPEELHFQTCSAYFNISFCGVLYEKYLCIDFPFTPSSWGVNNTIKIKLPNISLKNLSGSNATAGGLTRDFIIKEDFLRGWLLKIASFKKNDPNWIYPFIPYIISKPIINDLEWEFTLVNPTKLTEQNGKLMSSVITDQSFPELPRVFN